MADPTKYAYMVFDRTGGPQAGAILVFAPSAREAHRLSWPVMRDLYYTERFVDVRVKPLVGGADYHRIPEKEATGEPYVVDTPEPCDECELWWADGYDEQGLCLECAEAIRDPSPSTVRGVIERHGRKISARLTSSVIMDDWPEGTPVLITRTPTTPEDSTDE